MISPNYSNSNIQFKVHYLPSEEIRRFHVEKESIQNCESLTKLLGMKSSDDNMKIQYQDDEDDFVTIESDHELLHAIHLHDNGNYKLMRIRVVPRPSNNNNESLSHHYHPPHHYHHHRQFPHLLFQPFQNRSTPPRCFNSPPLRRFRGKKIARAMMFKENGNLNKSEKILKKILTWNNNRPLVHFKLACVLSLQDRPKEALDEIKEALKTGFDKIDSIYEEKDLEAVRNLPNFEKQIKKIMNRNSKKNCSMKKSTGSKKKKNEELDEKDSLSSSGEDIDRNESKEYEHKSPQDTVQEHYPSPSAPPAEIMIGRVQSKYPKEMEMLHEMGLTDSEKNMLALERNQGVIAKALKEIIS